MDYGKIKTLSPEKMKQREAAEKILQGNVIEGDRITSVRQFRRHVTKHDFPVIVLFHDP
jgi:hypothetical protein